MDTNAIGRFIAELRKQKGYTQKDLAEKLMVTDKALYAVSIIFQIAALILELLPFGAVFICSVIAAVLSLVPLLLFGSISMTTISYIITAMMLASICLQAVANRKEYPST